MIREFQKLLSKVQFIGKLNILRVWDTNLQTVIARYFMAGNSSFSFTMTFFFLFFLRVCFSLFLSVCVCLCGCIFSVCVCVCFPFAYMCVWFPCVCEFSLSFYASHRVFLWEANTYLSMHHSHHPRPHTIWSLGAPVTVGRPYQFVATFRGHY